jgi:hypothetical protein
MPSLSADVRLRPVRFAFIVRPDDRKRVLEILQTNTCLWGGQFNPIIPYFKRVPTWWDRHGHRFDSPVQIINGYLDFFEPDFVVEAEPGLATDLGLDKRRSLQLGTILPRGRDRRRESSGLSVFHLYRDLYRREFQFVRRHPHHVVEANVKQSSMRAFSACLFGGFPEGEDLTYFAQAFRDAFEPKLESLTGESLAHLYKTGYTSALQLGLGKIEIRYQGHSERTLFVLDATESRDLIDFWNLRAIQRDLIPIPKQWLGDLANFCREYIISSFRPLPNNPNNIMLRATVMFSRSIPSAQIEDLHSKYFRVDLAGANVLQDWYPPIWRPVPDIAFGPMRPTLISEEKTVDVPVSGERQSIPLEVLSPDFADRYGNEHRWANVINLTDWTHEDRIATTYPCNIRDASFPSFGLGLDLTIPTTEGVVVFPSFKTGHTHVDLQDGTSAIQQWLKTAGIDAETSESGRSTQQIIQSLGGFWGVGSFAHAEIVRLLNDVSRRPIAQSIQYQDFKNRIGRAIKGDIWRHKNAETLIERKAVELGLELKCTKCSSWSWHPLRQLGYQVTCSLCLQEFRFPIAAPSDSKKSKWAYRLIGPFALPNYANGGYAAALAIRFFAEIMGRIDRAGVTWSAGQKMKLSPTEEIEADFVLWYQRKRILANDYPTELVFGEAKSFRGRGAQERHSIRDAFEVDDIERLKTLACRFPGSILVFTTMKQASEL